MSSRRDFLKSGAAVVLLGNTFLRKSVAEEKKMEERRVLRYEGAGNWSVIPWSKQRKGNYIACLYGDKYEYWQVNEAPVGFQGLIYCTPLTRQEVVE